MKKIKFTNPSNFEDFHYELAENIKNCMLNKCEYSKTHEKDKITDIIACLNNTLSIGLMLKRKNGEEIAEKYRVVIEKI